jgi:hypothetical protein
LPSAVRTLSWITNRHQASVEKRNQACRPASELRKLSFGAHPPTPTRKTATAAAATVADAT